MLLYHLSLWVFWSLCAVFIRIGWYLYYYIWFIVIVGLVCALFVILERPDLIIGGF